MLTKFCYACKTEKLISEFNKTKTRKDGLQNKCRDCQKAYHKAWSEKNLEAKRLKNKEHRMKNAERISKYKAERYKENKQHILEVQREYEKNNKPRLSAKRARRRAAQNNATPDWLTTEDILAIDKFYELREELNKLTGVKHHVDHIVPLRGKTVCGLHVPWNLQVIPAVENLSKSNKL